MAWGAVNFGANEQASADKPLLITENVARLHFGAQTPQWSTSGLWSDSAQVGMDENATRINEPPRWSHDLALTRRTSPLPVGTPATFYLLWRLTQSVSVRNAGIVDSIVIANHNFADITGDLDIAVHIDDAQDFNHNPAQIAAWSLAAPHSPERLVDVLPFRYVGVEYVRMAITISPGTWSTVSYPRIGEVVLGRRRQLARAPDEPSDDRAARSEVRRFEPQNGDAMTYVHAEGRRELDLSFTANELDTLDDVATWSEIFDDLGGGTRPFWYLRRPLSNPQDASLVYFDDPRDLRDWLGPHHVEVSKLLLEKPPFYRTEVL